MIKNILFSFLTFSFCILLACGAAEIHFYLQNKTFYFKDDQQSLNYFRYPLNLKNYNAVIALGGSTTYGLGVRDGEDWPSLLARELGLPIINLGRLGAHLQEFRLNAYVWQSKRFLAEDLYFNNWSSTLSGKGGGWLSFKPKIIYLAPVINDTVPWLYYSTLNRAHPFLGLAIRILSICPMGEKLILVHHLKKFILKMMEKDIHPDFLSAEDLNFIRNRLIAELEQFFELCQREKIMVNLIGFPILFNQIPEERESELFALNQTLYSDLFKMRFILEKSVQIERQVFELVAKKYNARYVCAACRLDKKPLAEKLNYFVDPIHLNVQGQKIIVQDILNSLHREGK